MNETKSISKKKGRTKQPVNSQEQEKLNLLIAKNPNLKTLIEKLDLVLINTSES